MNDKDDESDSENGPSDSIPLSPDMDRDAGDQQDDPKEPGQDEDGGAEDDTASPSLGAVSAVAILGRRRIERESALGVKDPGSGEPDTTVIAVLVSVVTRSAIPVPMDGVESLSSAPDEHRYEVGAAHAPDRFRKRANQLLEKARERLAEHEADMLTSGPWNATTSNWKVIDFGGFDDAADRVSAFQEWAHTQVRSWLDSG